MDLVEKPRSIEPCSIKSIEEKELMAMATDLMKLTLAHLTAHASNQLALIELIIGPELGAAGNPCARSSAG